MLRLLLGVAFLALFPNRANAGEEPSWFVYRSDSLTVHVCNGVKDASGRVPLTVAAPQLGGIWAHEQKLPTETSGYLALPMIFSEAPSATVFARVGRRSFPSVAVWQEHTIGGRFYVLVVFQEAFSLGKVTGFRYRDVELKQESKLR